MPVINFSYSDLCELMGTEISREDLREKLPMIGAALEAMDDSSDDVSFEFFPSRPDLYSVEGIARALRAFLGQEPGLRSYAVGDAKVDLDVDPSVNEVRPYIWSALVEGNEITDPLIRSMMDLQEKLHLTVGRNRKKVAIGIHDYRTVKPPFTYKAVLPDEISFIPLQGSTKMTPERILREHEKGRAYAFVLEGKKRYPMIVDKDGEVLSFPPIINGITTAVTENTQDIFVDCTGTDINAVTLAVNILTTALAERGGKISCVKIHRDGGTAVAPDLTPTNMRLEGSFVSNWIGIPLKDTEIADSLKRMGYGATADKKGVEVLIPRYRWDVIHPVDLVEDVTIGYGFGKFGNVLPKRATFGEEEPLIGFSEASRSVMIGLGYFEVVTLSLSNPAEQFASMQLKENKTAVYLKNPVSTEHGLLRVSLLPSLLAILRKNKHRELPQKIFEVGDVVIDGRNVRMLSAVSIHARASFTEEKSVAQSVLAAFGLECQVSPGVHPSFIDGRCAEISSAGTRLGIFGEISPLTIEAFDLRYPVIALELDLERIFTLVANKRNQ